MISDSGAEKCVAAACRRLRIVRERLFPPTWVEALRQIKKGQSDPASFVVHTPVICFTTSNTSSGRFESRQS